MLPELVPEFVARLSDPKKVAVCFVFIFPFPEAALGKTLKMAVFLQEYGLAEDGVFSDCSRVWMLFRCVPQLWR